MASFISFSGRLGRLGCLWRTLVFPVAIAISMAITAHFIDNIFISITIAIITVPLIWLSLLGITARRLHDLNMSGWTQLLPTLIGIILVGFAAASNGGSADTVPDAKPPVMTRQQMYSAQQDQLRRLQVQMQQQRLPAQQQETQRQQLRAKHKQQEFYLIQQERAYQQALAARSQSSQNRMNQMRELQTSPMVMISNLIQFVFALFLLFWPGSPGTNSYGPEP